MIPSKQKEMNTMEYPMENRTRRQGRLSVGLGLFLTCIVLTTIIGLFGGLLISN